VIVLVKANDVLPDDVVHYMGLEMVVEHAIGDRAGGHMVLSGVVRGHSVSFEMPGDTLLMRREEPS
jgi:hypothetical protein